MVRPLMTSGYHHGFDGVIISSTIAIMQINGFCLLASLAFSSNGRFQHRMQTRLCEEASGVEDMSKENDKLTGTATTIYFIRHAETKENVRMRSLLQAGKSIVKFQYPTTRDIKNGLKFVSTSFLGMNDSVLTEKGQQQVQELGRILRDSGFWDTVDVVAHSPLIRAKETCLGALSEYSHRSEDWSSSSNRVVELECLRELTPYQRARYGGRLRRPLRKRIQQLQEWIVSQTTTTRAASRQRQGSDQKQEPQATPTQERTSIVLVGHSEYFRVLLNLTKKFQNCDVWKAEWNAVEGTWSRLELLHRLQSSVEEKL